MSSSISKIGKVLFKVRSYTPVPFVVIMVVFFNPTPESIITGFLLFLTGALYRFTGVAYAGPGTRSRDKGPEKLAVSGPFAFHRNPLYAGNIMIYTGFAAASNIVFPYFLLVVLLFFILQYSVIVSFEEEFLEKKFGTSYQRYKQNVKRWLPSFSKTGKRKNSNPDFKMALKSERRTLQNYGFVITLMAISWLIKR